jgi:hypothetical protein
MLGADLFVPTVVEQSLSMGATKRVVQIRGSRLPLGADLKSVLFHLRHVRVLMSIEWRGRHFVVIVRGVTGERCKRVQKRSETVWEGWEVVEGGKLSEVASKFYHSRSSSESSSSSTVSDKIA